MQKLWQFHGGLKLDGHKAESMHDTVKSTTLPQLLIIPVQQHIGEPAQPCVAVGDKVLKGQMIARADSTVSAPVHASSSGTVIAIESRPVPHPSGMSAECIVIETDGKDEWIALEPCKDRYKTMEPAQLRALIRDAGIVGLGGAGFPSYIKLNADNNTQIDTLILNGAECEPYITCDAMLMQERPRDILDGLLIMRQALQAKRCLIGIEDNKPTAIKALQEALTQEEKAFIDIVVVPAIYPAGGEKQLIKTLTGIEVPTQQVPHRVGIVCHNVGTARAIADAVIRGMPLTSRYVTVTGQAVNAPANFEVLLGTPIHELLTHAQLDRNKLKRTLMGGPMMGFKILDLNEPVIKTTNCILAASAEDVAEPQTTMPCIRCGECAHVCPANLLPQQLYWFARAKDFDKIQDYKLFDCIECGCCAHVCPSHIPLVQYYRFAKTEIWEKERLKHKSDIARERHEFHLYRTERKKQEDEERKRKKREMLKKAHGETIKDDPKKAAIQAALERVKARKSEQDAHAKNIDDLTEEQRQQIKEVDARRKKQHVTHQDSGEEN